MCAQVGVMAGIVDGIMDGGGVACGHRHSPNNPPFTIGLKIKPPSPLPLFGSLLSKKIGQVSSAALIR